jgi:hypothetical protein
MTKANMFLRITKVNMQDKTVSGIMTEEVTDKVKEKMDYTTSKTYFQKWSDGIAKGTGGKSLGNVRWMHQPISAGKVIEMNFNDEDKSIFIVTKPIDDDTLNKIDEGYASGFSIGGNVIGKMWADPDEAGVRRYTVDPVEVSYVDNPCLGSCTFQRIAADGATEERTFKVWEPGAEAVVEEAGKIALEKGGSYSDHMAVAKANLIAAKAAEAEGEVVDPVEEPAATETEKTAVVSTDPVAEVAPAPTDWNIVQVFRCEVDGSIHAKKADAVEHVKALKTLEANGSPLAAAIAKVKAAMSGETVDESVASVCKFDPQPLADVSALMKNLVTTDVAKGMYQLSELARVVDRVLDLQMMSAWEEQAEGDTASTAPTALAVAVKQLGEILVSMAQEEVAELVAGMKDGAGEVIPLVIVDSDPLVVECATRALTVIKSDTALMEKSGKRNSDKDQKHIQAAHDSSVKAGATCDPDNTTDKTVTGTIEKITAERDTLAKQMAEALPQITELGESFVKMQGELTKANAKIEELSAQPAPMPEIRGRVVGKGADGLGGADKPMEAIDAAGIVSELIKSIGVDKVRDLMISASLKNPIPLNMRD